MLTQKFKYCAIAVLLLVLFQAQNLFSSRYKNTDYKILEVAKVSSFNQDRFAFQHIEINYDDDKPFQNKDNSISNLLIIKDRKMYLFKDGYDDPFVVKTQKQILDSENRSIPDLWKNKVDNSPDYITITDRRHVILQKIVKAKMKDDGTLEDTKDAPKNLQKKYEDVFLEVRKKLLETHAKIFKSLLLKEKENIFTVRKPLPKKHYTDREMLFFTSATTKTIDGTVYYAEDADGDGVTETFTVNIRDGFRWGAQSGPNIIFIYNCQYVDKDNKEKNKVIKDIIGTLANEAHFGTKEEEEKLISDLQKNKEDMKEMVDNMYLFDSKKYIKEYK